MTIDEYIATIQQIYISKADGIFDEKTARLALETVYHQLQEEAVKEYIEEQKNNSLN